MASLYSKLVRSIADWIGPLLPARLRELPLLTEISSVALFIGGGIGDAVMVYPALKLLKQTLPAARIDVYVPERKARIVAALLNEFPVFGMTVVNAGMLVLRSLLKRYDLALANPSAVSFPFFEMSGRFCSRLSIGFRSGGTAIERSLFHYSVTLVDQHDIDQSLALVRSLFNVKSTDPDLFFPRSDKVWQRNGAPIVLVHPGGEPGRTHQLWPIDHFRQIVQRLSNEECRVKVIIGPADVKAYAALGYITRVDFLVNSDPQTLIHEFKQADLFIGNASGPAHMAAFFGLPSVVLVGPGARMNGTPRSLAGVNMCGSQICPICRYPHEPCSNRHCMGSISVEQTWEVITRMLENGLLR